MASGAQASTGTTGGRLARGLRNNNPGNIRFITPQSRAWNGQIGDDGGGYGVYSSMDLGIRATGRQLLKYYETNGLDTIREIIAKWAPASENQTEPYIAAVSSALRIPSTQPFNVRERLAELALAIFNHENGRVAVANFRDSKGNASLSLANISRRVYE